MAGVLALDLFPGQNNSCPYTSTKIPRLSGFFLSIPDGIFIPHNKLYPNRFKLMEVCNLDKYYAGHHPSCKFPVSDKEKRL